MKSVFFVLMLLMVFSCSEETRYHSIYDIDGYWRSASPLTYRFDIQDSAAYDISCDLRNSSDYQWSRLFIAYTLRDSAGHLTDSLFLERTLFDPVSGAPAGEAGIGDLYEQEFPVRTGYRFPGKGRYIVQLVQMMRTDSLTGIVSAGIRIEKSR